MPNGIDQPPQQLPKAPRPPSYMRAEPQLQAKIYDRLSDISARVKLVEDQLQTIRSHIEVVDNSVIEKHKALISEVRKIEDDLRSLRADVDKVNSLSERLVERLEAFATKEDVKVLERYVNMWQPMNYMTKQETENLIRNILKQSGVRIKEKKED